MYYAFCCVVIVGPQELWVIFVILCAGGESVVWHFLLLLTNSFNKTEAAIFLMQAQCYLRAFYCLSCSLL